MNVIMTEQPPGTKLNLAKQSDSCICLVNLKQRRGYNTGRLLSVK